MAAESQDVGLETSFSELLFGGTFGREKAALSSRHDEKGGYHQGKDKNDKLEIRAMMTDK